MSIENVRGLMTDLPASTLASAGASTPTRPDESTAHSTTQTTNRIIGFATVLAHAAPQKSGAPQTAIKIENPFAKPVQATADADATATARTTGCRCSHEEEGMVGEFGGLAANFSFFVRVSGDVGQIGRETMSRFRQAAEEVTTTFLSEAGWTASGSDSRGPTADPVGAFLQESETALLQGSDRFDGFLDEIRTAVTEGLQPLIGALSRNQPLFAGIPAAFSPSLGSASGYGSVAGGASSSAAPALPGSVSTAWSIAQLRLSSMDLGSLQNNGSSSTGSNGSTTGTSLTPAVSRPPVHNRGGQVLIKVDSPIDDRRRTPLVIATKGDEPARTTTDNGRTDKVMRAFLGKFLDFIGSLREDLENPDTHTTTPSAVSPDEADAQTAPSGSETVI